MINIFRGIYARYHLFYNAWKNVYQIATLFILCSIILIIGIVQVNNKLNEIGDSRAKLRNENKEVVLYKKQVDAVRVSETESIQNAITYMNDRKQVLKNLEQKIQRFKTSSLSRDDFIYVLKKVIDSSQGLTLNQLTNMPEKMVLNTNSMNIFEFQVQMNVTGDYFSLMDFFKKLEDTRLNIHWSTLSYTVSNYPKANIALNFAILTTRQSEPKGQSTP
jgi:MSHA biogenesis protein MshJ